MSVSKCTSSYEVYRCLLHRDRLLSDRIKMSARNIKSENIKRFTSLSVSISIFRFIEKYKSC